MPAQPRWFRCLVGSQAQEALRSDSSPDAFNLMLAASGGPRWLGLVGLDRALARFLRERRTGRLAMLGASSGAWRVAALASDNDLTTYTELEHEYIEQRYEGLPSPEFVSRTCRDYLTRIFDPERISFALSESVFQVNLTTAIVKTTPRSRSQLFRWLVAAVVCNSLDRQLLGRLVRRGHFYGGAPGVSSPILDAWDGVATRKFPLSRENFVQALLASGSIPFVLHGESDIPGAGDGHHYDGGLIDYHFEIEREGPILYPHFSTDPLPGWLDRFFPRRRITRRARRQLCLLLPSPELLSRYPSGRFPGREDFENFDNEERIRRWRAIVKENTKMEKELTACLEAGELLRIAEPFG